VPTPPSPGSTSNRSWTTECLVRLMAIELAPTAQD
jgi:hypothetical protein